MKRVLIRAHGKDSAMALGTIAQSKAQPSMAVTGVAGPTYGAGGNGAAWAARLAGAAGHSLSLGRLALRLKAAAARSPPHGADARGGGSLP